MTLTLRGCNQFCGAEQTWYTDVGPRLGVWLIPILLLLANVELSPVDKSRFQGLLHLLGDPIGSIWSMLHKLDAANSCTEMAMRYRSTCHSCHRIVAAVFAGLEEVQGPRITSDRDFDALIQQNGGAMTRHFTEWRRAAVRLADGRTNELGRTMFAFLLYVLQLVAAFVPEVGGPPPGPPGGRIATGVLLSWLVPVIFLSNAIGQLPSSRTAYNILSDLVAHTGPRSDKSPYISHRRSVLLPSFPSMSKSKSTDYFEALPWSGAIHTYRPWKGHSITNSRHPHLHGLLIATLATLLVLIWFIGGVLILWYQLPVGLNCRYVWLVGVTVAWLISALFSWTTYSTMIATGVYHWRITLIKDAFVATAVLLIMFLSGVGLFNFCWCWSGPFQYPGGRVPLPETVYLQNAWSVYPTIVGVTLVLELSITAAVMVIWRRGLQLLRWSERACREEWDHVMRGTVCGCSHPSPYERRESEVALLKSGIEVITLERDDAASVFNADYGPRG